MNNYPNLELCKKLNWQGETEKVWITYKDIDTEYSPKLVNTNEYLFTQKIFKIISEYHSPSIAEMLEELIKQSRVLEKVRVSRFYIFFMWLANNLIDTENSELADALAELCIKLIKGK